MNLILEKLLLRRTCTIREALCQIDKGEKGTVVIVDKDMKLVGMLTDGDVRRALLKGALLEDKIENIIQYHPVFGTVDMSKDQIRDLFIKRAVKQIPIINKERVVTDLVEIRDILIPEGKKNIVLIMAGGLGTRLKDLTKEVPKPMLIVGDDPILHHIINNFRDNGYYDFLISVNHKAEIIENYFQDGAVHGVKIHYIREKKRLGTAGGIKEAEAFLDRPFFVINGDILTNLRAENMMAFHQENGFDITVGIRKDSYQIPYGVIEVDNSNITRINEKPTVDYMINSGIYCLNPSVIEFIPKDSYFEITELINICIENGLKIGGYEITEYWMDIGHLQDYHKANDDYETIILKKQQS